MSPRVACLLVLLTGAVLCTPAVSAADISLNSSMLLIGAVAPSGTGGPNPDITYLVGASVPLPVAGVFFLEPMLEVFGTYYEWVPGDSVAVPTVIERGTSFFTLGTLVSAHGGVDLPLSAAVSLGVSLGLDVLLRFPLELTNSLPESVAGRAPALGYFFGGGRFFYPETRLFLRWKMSDTFTLVMNVRAFYPLFHLWDGLSQPFVDQFMVSGGLGLAFRLGASTPTVR